MIPNAPTDNLYKFVTVLGVALMIFCAWSSTEAVKRVNAANVDEYIRNIQDRVEQSAANADNTILTEYAKIPQDQLTAEQQTVLNEAIERAVERLGGAITKITNDVRPIMQWQESRSELLMYRIGTGVGAVIAAIGFAAWYFLHQRYQDAILRRQLSSDAPATVAEAD